MASRGDAVGTHDVIIVGAGSAGCLLAGRLAATTDMKILILENGGRDRNPLIHIPSGFAKMLEYGQFVYPYVTVPQAHLNGRTVPLDQGFGLGGGSSVNALVYVRGQPADYQAWDAATGHAGLWSHETMLSHFRAMERSDIFSAPLHGYEGPLSVTQPPGFSILNRAAIRAFQEFGLPYNADYNGASQAGVSPCQLTIGKARRSSAATAFLHPAEHYSNLDVHTRALVTRLVLEGDRVVGVEFVSNGEHRRAQSNNVILSAGAFNTPRLLMLSGIGPEDELRQHGIEVRVRSEDVGKNLHDHPQSPVMARAKGPYGYSQYASGLGMLAAGARYLIDRSGPAATNGIESVSYFNPDDPSGDPTIQSFHSPVMHSGLATPDPHPGVTLTSTVLQPKSRGSVRLRDADPGSMPLIDPNFMSHPEDMRRIIGGLRYVREVMAQPSLRDLLEGDTQPSRETASDADLAQYVRETLSTMWHPVGTCRMGADGGSVVDPWLRVRGVRGLRVMDASIMPQITSGNTNAPTLALASRGLEFFLKDLGIDPRKPAKVTGAAVDSTPVS